MNYACGEEHDHSYRLFKGELRRRSEELENRVQPFGARGCYYFRRVTTISILFGSHEKARLTDYWYKYIGSILG